MLVFRGVLVAVFLCLTAYTVQVVTTYGLGLFAVFSAIWQNLVGQVNSMQISWPCWPFQVLGLCGAISFQR